MKIAKSCICCGSQEIEKTPAILAPFVAHRAFGWSPVEITAEWGFRDIRIGMAQTICMTVACADCGAIFLDMRFDDEELASLYSDYRGEQYTILREQYEPGYSNRNKTLLEKPAYIPVVEKLLSRHLNPNPVVLDWGGDTGLNTPFAAIAARHDVYDISGKETIGRARRVDYASIGRDYDLIVCSQVLEHVADPLLLMRQIAACMSETTVLYAEIPYESLMQKIANGESVASDKRHWHEHVNFFTPESLQAMATLIDLDVIEIGSIPLVVGQVEGSGLYLIASKPCRSSK